MATRNAPRSFPLSPLAFPAETDMRFLLLIIAAVGILSGLGDFSLYILFQMLPISDALAQLLGLIGTLLFTPAVFLLAYKRAQRAAARIIAERSLKPFPPMAANAAEQRSLERLRGDVEQLVARLPGMPAQRPRFFWNDTTADSVTPAGMAFGFRPHSFVSLNQGVHSAFVATPEATQFRAVLLHELGHIANRDVSRTVFSIELGRALTQAILLLAGVAEGYMIFHLARRALNGTLGEVDPFGTVVLFQIAIGTVLVIGLVTMIRASVLRVREYYADTRALQWLGQVEPLRAMLVQRRGQPTPPGDARHGRPGLVARAMLPAPQPLQLFHQVLAPLHPTHAQRVAVLEDQRQLFAVDLLTVFFAAVLSGLAVNANSVLLTVPLRLGSAVNTWLSESLSLTMSITLMRLIGALSFTLSLLSITVLLAAFAICFFVPLVGTVGTMLQRAAFADSFGFGPAPLLPFRRMLVIAFTIGCGVVVGGTVAPNSGALTLHGFTWLMAPLFVIAWALVSLIWLLPLRWLAGRVFRSHSGERPPVMRRRCVAVLAACAGGPLLTLTVLGQGSIKMLGDASVPVEGFAVLLGLWLGAIPLSLLIWGAGALLMRAAGWFGSPRCPSCRTLAPDAPRQALHCAGCGHPLRAWALVPAPLCLPQPPPAQHEPDEGPPPL